MNNDKPPLKSPYYIIQSIIKANRHIAYKLRDKSITFPKKEDESPFSKKTRGFYPNITSFQCFPLSNFKYFLTLFSKFFSSFPHGTCSLSVSRLYLALDETYHPFRAAIPNNSTL